MELKSNKIPKDVIVIEDTKSFLKVIGFVDTTNELLFTAIQYAFFTGNWFFEEWDIETQTGREVGRVTFEIGTVITVDLLYDTLEKLEIEDWNDY